LRGFGVRRAAPETPRQQYAGELVAADSLVTWVIRQRNLPIEKVVQLSPSDVKHLMFVIVRAVTKRAVVVLEA
jgi:hypothetical protein